MQLGEGIEWTVHCCTVLGCLPPNETLSSGKLAEFHGVPPAYLSKQLQLLKRAGIVTSTAGRRGGFKLGRPPADITLLDIVIAIEGDEPAFRCSEIRQRGPAAVAPDRYVKPCGIARAMWRAEDVWRAELAKTSVADLLAELGTSLDPESVDKSLVWFADATR